MATLVHKMMNQIILVKYRGSIWDFCQFALYLLSILQANFVFMIRAN